MIIQVIKDGQRMWVSNPNKIKFWKAIAEISRQRAMPNPKNALVKVTKEVKGDKG